MFNKVGCLLRGFCKKSISQSRAAFSLVEMLVIVTASGLIIFGTLKAGDLITKARVSSVISEVNSIKTAMQQFKVANDSYPGDIATTSIKRSNDTVVTFTGFNIGNNDGMISFGNSTIDENPTNESLLLNAHLVNAGYLSYSVSSTPSDFQYTSALSSLNLLKSTKISGLFYTVISFKKDVNGASLAFTTPSNSQINFAGNNIVLGGASDANTASGQFVDASSQSAYFNATATGPMYTPTVPVLSQKVVLGLVNTFGSSVKYCDNPTVLDTGTCNTSDSNVASVAIL